MTRLITAILEVVSSRHSLVGTSLIALATLFWVSPSSGNINLTYNNVTGDFQLLETAPTEQGPGIRRVSVFQMQYGWDFGLPFVDLLSIRSFLLSLDSEVNLFQGTAAGVTIDELSSGTETSGSILGLRFDLSASAPVTGGPLSLTDQSGTASASLWTLGLGTFVGNAQNGTSGTTTAPFTVTVIPEAGSFAFAAGLFGLAAVGLRRRRSVR
ncbi:MAG: hypothetical protein AAGJ81_07305 [Verrucomicrobiota bacterium]